MKGEEQVRMGFYGEIASIIAILFAALFLLCCNTYNS